MFRVNFLSVLPKVAVVIPVYNAEPYLSRCLNSLIAQTYQSWVAICVDDGSTDNSYRILSQYAMFDSRIKVLKQENGGVGKARNTALNHLYSAYSDHFDAICFVDSDDFVTPDMLEILVNTLQAHRVDLAIGSFCRDSISSQSKINLKKQGYLSSLNWLRMIYSTQKFRKDATAGGYAVRNLYAKSLLKDVRFTEDRQLCEDELFNFSVCLKNPKIYYVNKLVYIYCYNKASLSNEDNFSISNLRGREVALLQLTTTQTLEKRKRTQYQAIVMAGFIQSFLSYRHKHKSYKKLEIYKSIPNRLQILSTLVFNAEIPIRRVIKFLFCRH